jgi:hypothetical protein
VSEGGRRRKEREKRKRGREIRFYCMLLRLIIAILPLHTLFLHL